MSAAGEMGSPPARVLLVGLPRSGTTWVSNALGHCDGATLVHEPDNDRLHVAALLAKARLGRHPILAPGESAPAYRTLLRAAFGLTTEQPGDARRRHRSAALAERAGEDAIDRVMGDLPPRRWPWPLALARRIGAPPAPTVAEGPIVVKSVHGALALSWTLEEVAPTATAVLVRHPANVIGSWRDMGWQLHRFAWHRPELWERFGPTVGNPGVGCPATPIEQGAWQFALLANALLAAAQACRLPVVDHEEVLADPVGRLSALAATLGLGWTDAATAWVAASDAPGEGYELRRVAAAEQGRWRTRLTPEELAVVADVVGRFPRLEGRWELA